MTFVSIDNQNKRATIELNCKEIRDIANLMCNNHYHGKLHAEFFLLFELVKNGCIDGFTVEELFKLFNEDQE